MRVRYARDTYGGSSKPLCPALLQKDSCVLKLARLLGEALHARQRNAHSSFFFVFLGTLSANNAGTDKKTSIGVPAITIALIQGAAGQRFLSRAVGLFSPSVSVLL